MLRTALVTTARVALHPITWYVCGAIDALIIGAVWMHCRH